MGSSFADNLQKIRYRDGVIDGYTSRLHYTSDWIENGVRQGFLEDVTAQNSTQTTQNCLSLICPPIPKVQATGGFAGERETDGRA